MVGRKAEHDSLATIQVPTQDWLNSLSFLNSKVLGQRLTGPAESGPAQKHCRQQGLTATLLPLYMPEVALRWRSGPIIS